MAQLTPDEHFKLSSMGGKKGGQTRAAQLTHAEHVELGRKAAAARLTMTTPEQRSEVARKAAAARWKGHEPAKGKAGS
jgi:hypothetical protein